MDKPLVLIFDDLYNDLINTINESSLPPSQLEPIIRKIYDEVVASRQQESAAAKRQYEAALAKEQENATNTENN